MSAATAFLDRFRKAEKAGNPVEAFADDPAGFRAALSDMPTALFGLIDGAVRPEHGATALVHEDCFASAACDHNGSLIVGDERFNQWFDDIDPFLGIVRNISADQPKVSLFADDRSGRPVALAAGSVAVSRNWPLAANVRAALADGHARYAITAFRAGDLSWTHAARAYGFTEAESMLVAALARTGDLKLAATERGIAYETARKFVAAAMRKTRTNRQTALIRETLMVAAGDLPDSQNLGDIARDLFGLTPRQADLAVMIGNGATRERAAAIIGISDHGAKADLKVIFQACGVKSAVDLARVMAEINALKGLSSACDLIIHSHGSDHEPLQFVQRSWAQGRIAISDHGPIGGKPVVILHSNVSGRHHPRSFIAALRTRGFRPICFDRAGYGLTTPQDGDPVGAGVNDLVDVLDALGLERVALLARCNTASAVAASAHATGRISGAVLLWPEATPGTLRRQSRMNDVTRTLFLNFPSLTDGFVKLICRRTSAAMIEKSWQNSFYMPIDFALIDDPQERQDLIRGTQQAIYGVRGFVAEMLAHGSGAMPARIADARNWTLIYSPANEPEDLDNAVAQWGAQLAGATITHCADGGHFMHVTHHDVVIDALERAVGC